MVALVDAPSDMKGSDGMHAFSKETKQVFRISEEHAQDIEAVVNYLKKEATNNPVWLVGTSLGTFSASNCAIRIKEGINGLILTSSVTRSRKKWRIYTTHPNAIIDMDLDKIAVPTLIISHREDKCEGTPAADAPRLKAALVNSPKVEVMYFTGGKKPREKRCRGLSAHGFYGIEDEVVAAIAGFIKANSK
jgi:pimeloyl-ACP methyl ester carboxylesterase